MGKIVVGVDGSAGSRAALRWAHAEAQLRRAPLEVVHGLAVPGDDQPPCVRRRSSSRRHELGGRGVAAGDPAGGTGRLHRRGAGDGRPRRGCSRPRPSSTWPRTPTCSWSAPAATAGSPGCSSVRSASSAPCTLRVPSWWCTPSRNERMPVPDAGSDHGRGRAATGRGPHQRRPRPDQPHRRPDRPGQRLHAVQLPARRRCSWSSSPCGEYRDALFGIVLVANALIGIVQEVRAKRTLDRLAVLNAPRSTVRPRRRASRGRRRRSWCSTTLVVLAPATRSPSTATCSTPAGLEVDESLLTGEADPVVKDAGRPVHVRAASWSPAAAASGPPRSAPRPTPSSWRATPAASRW